jgi:aminoglycoside/choline kinase family phosphotransferase
METKLEQRLSDLFTSWTDGPVDRIEKLPAHGSERQYYRIFGKTGSAIAAHNLDRAENNAFITFSKHFHDLKLPVPEIYGTDLDHGIYLEQDLGDTTLFSYLSEIRAEEDFSPRIIDIYRKVIERLPEFQIIGGRDLDYSICYPRYSFDRQSMMWDLNYFKYYFLKLAKIAFDEQKLEDDFQNFTTFLLAADREYFLYRDFQSRNVMLVDGEPYFIDYQGGRKGALQYDVASLLYDAKADIPQKIREELLQRYIEAVSKIIPVDKTRFMEFYTGYVYIRIMQALGAYGFRGFYERKTHFLKSVPYAIQNLENLLQSTCLPIEVPELMLAWNGLIRSTFLRQLADVDLRLRVRIQSFSYKRGIPWDDKGHGGGFVFDCRALPNPGRFPEFADLTGNDEKVIAYFQDKEELKEFLHNITVIIDQVIDNYKSRNFTDLLVAFGCTGGQHRSVYCANMLKAHLQTHANIDVEVRHRELEQL